MALTIADILLGDVVEAMLHNLMFHHILDLLHGDSVTMRKIPFHLKSDFLDVRIAHLLRAVLIGAGYGIVNLPLIIVHREAGTLRDGLEIHASRDATLKG